MEASEKIRIYDKGVDRAGQVVSYGDALTVRSGDIVIPKISLQEPLRLECQHFVECVRDRKTPLTDGDDGLRVVRVLAAAQASLEAGGAPVAVAPRAGGGVDEQPPSHPSAALGAGTTLRRGLRDRRQRARSAPAAGSATTS